MGQDFSWWRAPTPCHCSRTSTRACSKPLPTGSATRKARSPLPNRRSLHRGGTPLNFGARAVSGYLIGDGQSQDDGGTTHAWAEIYLPGAGWIAFDPTHNRVGSAHLIPVAFARTNRQIMPVSGGYLGAAEDFASMDVIVRVQPEEGRLLAAQ